MAGLFPLPVVDPAAVLAGPAPRGLGRAMAGGGDKVNRRPHDFYPTPAPVTRALMRRESFAIRAIRWSIHPFLWRFAPDSRPNLTE